MEEGKTYLVKEMNTTNAKIVKVTCVSVTLTTYLLNFPEEERVYIEKTEFSPEESALHGWLVLEELPE